MPAIDGTLLSSLPTFAVHAGVFVGMVIVTILGWKFGLKKDPAPTDVRIAGGMIQDATTALMQAEAQRIMSERLHANTHQLERMENCLRDIHGELVRLNRNLEHR